MSLFLPQRKQLVEGMGKNIAASNSGPVLQVLVAVNNVQERLAVKNLQMTFFQGDNTVLEGFIAGDAYGVSRVGEANNLTFTGSGTTFQHQGAADDRVYMHGRTVLADQAGACRNLFPTTDFCQRFELVRTQSAEKAGVKKGFSG